MRTLQSRVPQKEMTVFPVLLLPLLLFFFSLPLTISASYANLFPTRDSREKVCATGLLMPDSQEKFSHLSDEQLIETMNSFMSGKYSVIMDNQPPGLEAEYQRYAAIRADLLRRAIDDLQTKITEYRQEDEEYSPSEKSFTLIEFLRESDYNAAILYQIILYINNPQSKYSLHRKHFMNFTVMFMTADETKELIKEYVDFGAKTTDTGKDGSKNNNFSLLLIVVGVLVVFIGGGVGVTLVYCLRPKSQVAEVEKAEKSEKEWPAVKVTAEKKV